MRPESFDSGTRLQTPTLIGCILLKNFAPEAPLTFVQRRDGIMRCFANPCQALDLLFFFEPRHFAVLAAVSAVNCEAYDCSIVFGLRQKYVARLG